MIFFPKYKIKDPIKFFNKWYFVKKIYPVILLDNQVEFVYKFEKLDTLLSQDFVDEYQKKDFSFIRSSFFSFFDGTYNYEGRLVEQIKEHFYYSSKVEIKSFYEIIKLKDTNISNLFVSFDLLEKI